MKRIQFGFLLLSLVWSHELAAQVVFEFEYADVGVGFNDPSLGPVRRSALQQAASVVESAFVNYSATIRLSVDGSETDEETLASAGSAFNREILDPGFLDLGDVMLKILNGDAADPAPNLPDGSVSWNFEDHAWQLGADFAAGEFDFLSTAIHELLHAVGFVSGILENGEDSYGTPPRSAGIWSPFDRYVSDRSGPLIGSSFGLAPVRWRAASVGGGGVGGLSFNGPETMAMNGGPLFLYSPEVWEEGSSGSHIDDEIYAGTYLMEAATDVGAGVRTLSGIEISVLRDIGYTRAVPEPTSQFVWPVLIGLAAWCRALRRPSV